MRFFMRSLKNIFSTYFTDIQTYKLHESTIIRFLGQVA
ncbi:hypothetical protein SAMN00120144_1357 [Hymenobacter roseosalivarius DSM 11622]|uniref:Uncharacterized protein n=1 Tax=Hymenobacter roseosalivarius DSM 11622 TaxID=645990 RepID=A0A1W1V2E4_9BACT|nr:hypothetical protein SAMN00120144_1357 [Hymenobacter roseosalivarius DSM 11622]